MLILGLILILVGALVFHYLGPERIIQFAAAVLVVVGLVLVLLGVAELADVNLDT